MKFELLCSLLLLIMFVKWKSNCIVLKQQNKLDNYMQREHIQKRTLTKRQTSTNHATNMYKECTTISGIKGSCVPNIYCALPELKTNFWTTLPYLCVIENQSIGICCSKQTISKEIPQLIANIDSTRNSDNDNYQMIGRSENRGCGLTTKQFPRIVGGRPAEPEEWPWVAAIIRRGLPNVYCGGVLISDRHILTAAHCTDKNTGDIFVRLGEYDFHAINETRTRDFQIAEIKQHVDFDPTTYENDIAIIRIERPTIFNTYIWPVCIPPPDENWEGWDGVVIGWGTKYFGGPHSNILMEVSVPIWQHKKCENNFLYRIGDNIICAGADEGGRDSCQGDSGGPLLVQLPNRRWVAVGIVSWGLRCGEKNHPGLYTRVNKYISWIIENSTK